jgi:hypothetical protein
MGGWHRPRCFGRWFCFCCLACLQTELDTSLAASVDGRLVSWHEAGEKWAEIICEVGGGDGWI